MLTFLMLWYMLCEKIDLEIRVRTMLRGLDRRFVIITYGKKMSDDDDDIQ